MADLYRYLAPFIDPNKPIFLSLDGEAAKKGVSEKIFDDAIVPDLWYTLVGKDRSSLVEAKIVEDGVLTIGQNQLCTWRTNGVGRHKPTAWVGANPSLNRFYFWQHEEFGDILDACTSQRKYPKLRVPKSARVFDDIRLIALELLRNA